MGPNKNRFKRLIKYLESSDGKNLNHETLTEGPNKGQTAGGAYGMVPGSAADFINQARNRNYVLPPDVEKLKKLSPDEVTKTLNENRELDEAMADVAADVMLAKTAGDEEKAAYGWRTGHNRDFKVLKDYLAHPYVEKYKKLKNQDK